MVSDFIIDILVFQSTLSSRRATGGDIAAGGDGVISIHALLTESDDYVYDNWPMPQISIHALLTESDSKYHQIGPIVSV